MRPSPIVPLLLTLSAFTACADDAPAPAIDAGSVDTGSTAAKGCITLDRLHQDVIPPAGVRVRFRVLDCDGYPVRALTADDVTMENNEKHEPFGAAGEGGGTSAPDAPAEFGFYSVLALDMSDSIFNNGAVSDVVHGAKVFVKKLVKDAEPGVRHKVAILVFGRTDATEVVLDFTDDAAALDAKLDELQAMTKGLGTTNLYGAYELALDAVRDEGKDLELVERFVVLLTDGTHEAGNEELLRYEALANKADAEDQSSVTIFSIGIKGSYAEEKLRELATKAEYFALADQASALTSAFSDVAARVTAVAGSNYVVGVCTPVELGSPSLTVTVDVDGATDSATLSYPTDVLDGDVASCDVALVADPCRDLQCGPSALAKLDCGACPLPADVCMADGKCCSPACDGKACGDDGCGGSCGDCGKDETCDAGQCVQ